MVLFSWSGSQKRQLPVMVAVFLFFMGDTMLYMTAVPLITYGVCRHQFPNKTSSFCLNINQHPEEQFDIQKNSASLLMVEELISTLPPMALSPIIGPWSDVHGRMLPFFAPFVGNVAAAILFGVAPRSSGVAAVVLVMAGFLLRACFGQQLLIHLMSGSCIVDMIDADGIVHEEIGAWRRRRGRKGSRGARGKSEEDEENTKEQETGKEKPRGKERQTPLLMDASSSDSFASLSVSRDFTNEAPTSESEGPGSRRDRAECLAAMARLQVAESLGTMVGPFLGWVLQHAGGAASSLAMSATIMGLGAAVVVYFTRKMPGPSARHAQHQGADDDNDGGEAATLLGSRSGCSKGSFSLVRVVKKKLKSLRTAMSCRRPLDIDPVLLWCCLLIMFFITFCGQGRMAVTVVFVQSPPLSWPNQRISAYMAAFSAFQSAFLFFATPCLHDHTVVGVSLATSALGGVWMGFSFSTWSMMLAGCLSQMLDCVYPALRAILARSLASQDQIGELMSRMTVAEALGNILGPVVVVQVFNATLDYFPGLVYLIIAAAPVAILVAAALAEACSSVDDVTRAGAWRRELIVPPEALARAELTRSLGVTRPAVLLRAAD